MRSKFLSYCKEYGKVHLPVEKVAKPWYECLSKERREANEDLVKKMMEFAQKKKMSYYLSIYYNGKRLIQESYASVPKVETYAKVPFGDPYILPLFFTSNKVAYDFDEILDPLGYFVEYWDIGKYIISDDKNINQDEWEAFKRDTSLQKEIYFGVHYGEAPEILKEISSIWSSLSANTGDYGGCVIGEGMKFSYGGQKYKMSPSSPWQGEGSWLPHVGYIKECLEAVGAKDICFDHGRLD